MKKLAILGLGHIGRYVLDTLRPLVYDGWRFSKVDGFDISSGHDLSKDAVIHRILDQYDGVLVSTPYYLNKRIAAACHETRTDYFDLTESVEVTKYISELPVNGTRFVTQCGLAPGMVSIIANNMTRRFDQVTDVKIRVGALPKYASNHLGYYRTWNTEGLINEYIHPCPGLQDRKLVSLSPLADQENIQIDGKLFEAANTSGGLGSLAETLHARGVSNANYKTLRYPGHWDHIRFLKDDLGLGANQYNFDTYVKLFNAHVPATTDDIVVILISVTGYRNGELVIDFYQKQIEAAPALGHTAIQIATGSGVLSVLDSWAGQKMIDLSGWLKQEDLDFHSIWNSQFNQCYQLALNTRNS